AGLYFSRNELNYQGKTSIRSNKVKLKFAPAGILLLFAACTSPDTGLDTAVEIPVSVEDVALKPIEEYEVTTGTVMATKDDFLKSEAAGFYRLGINPRTSRAFALGDFVGKDQVIIYLDNPEQENTIKIESHKLNLDNTRREFEKQESIYKKGGVTLRELKNAERTYIDAKYSYENALIQLSKLEVAAPFDGVIVDLPYYTRGVKVPVNTDIVHLMDYSALTMEINLPGKQLGRVEVGQAVRVMNYTLPDKTLGATVAQVSPAIDPDTRTFKARVDIDNPDLLLRPGMFVKAEIVTARADSAVVISKDVILTRRDRKTVFVVERGFAREHRITTGLENPDEIEITEGLEVKERLVVKGFETLRNRSKVKIVR
ncbi:MAG: efflux RND transporter periplasmic adaptor subunit, partial [Gemmatimonadota bacterium]|nr:efflux RND transporter periplasmic adaptor subunit [Gemmatimonadota bacterium]